MKKLKESVNYESSNIQSSVYDYKSMELIVTFTTGTAYSFSSVAPEDYHNFRDAESVGREFNRGIKPYGGKKI